MLWCRSMNRIRYGIIKMGKPWFYDHGNKRIVQYVRVLACSSILPYVDPTFIIVKRNNIQSMAYMKFEFGCPLSFL